MGALTLRRLGKLVQQLRTDAGYSMSDIEATKLMSRRTLARLENGTGCPSSWGAVVQLGVMCDAPPKVLGRLRELALSANEKNLVEAYEGSVPPDFNLYPDLEADASSLSAYEPELIPGLLQTPGYTYSIMAANESMTDELISRAALLRSERRKTLLAGTRKRSLRFLLTEGGITRRVGGEDVMAAQVESLRADAGHESIAIRVIPSSLGAYAAMTGPFVLLKFADVLDPAVVFLENLSGCSYLEEQQFIDVYSGVFDQTWRQATDILRWE